MAKKIEFKFPTTQQHTLVIGQTGSGKSQLAMWLLSRAPFDKQPYIIIDYKGDDLLNSVSLIKELGLGDEIPTQPGLYIVHANPVADDEAMNDFLWRVWAKENTGLVFDETYLIPGKGALQSLLTQGRSKHIPCLCLIQRPAWVSRFVFSEATFYAIFHLQHEDDRKKMFAVLPQDVSLENIKEYHSVWYDSKQRTSWPMLPVPPAPIIMQQIHDRLHKLYEHPPEQENAHAPARITPTKRII